MRLHNFIRKIMVDPHEIGIMEEPPKQVRIDREKDLKSNCKHFRFCEITAPTESGKEHIITGHLGECEIDLNSENCPFLFKKSVKCPMKNLLENKVGKGFCPICDTKLWQKSDRSFFCHRCTVRDQMNSSSGIPSL